MVECLYREQSREGRSLAGKYGATASMTLCMGAVQEHAAMVPEGAVRCIALVDSLYVLPRTCRLSFASAGEFL